MDSLQLPQDSRKRSDSLQDEIILTNSPPKDDMLQVSLHPMQASPLTDKNSTRGSMLSMLSVSRNSMLSVDKQPNQSVVVKSHVQITIEDGTYQCMAYTPQLPDELQISQNDHILILSVFRDGWCLGMNTRTGEKGVFPSDCLLDIVTKVHKRGSFAVTPVQMIMPDQVVAEKESNGNVWIICGCFLALVLVLSLGLSLGQVVDV
jgi:hypothetical protein